MSYSNSKGRWVPRLIDGVWRAVKDGFIRTDLNRDKLDLIDEEFATQWCASKNIIDSTI